MKQPTITDREKKARAKLKTMLVEYMGGRRSNAVTAPMLQAQIVREFPMPADLPSLLDKAFDQISAEIEVASKLPSITTEERNRLVAHSINSHCVKLIEMHWGQP
jgi:hypothetical protein